MAPRIAIPFWEEDYLRPYAEGVRREGGHVKAIPFRGTPAVVPAMADCAGLLLPGGGDVEPARYGASDPLGLCQRVDPARDQFEAEAIAFALEQDLAVLAICRGHQMLSVALGGALVLDIPTELPRSLNHRREKADLDAHLIECTPGSKIAGIVGTKRIVTNSRHHQAVRADRPGQHLAVTALAEDGIVEACESTRHGFVVGVQWHPETFVGQGDRFAPLFRAFVQHAAQRSGATEMG